MAKLFVNNLTIIDSSLLDQKRGVVGESWRVDVELEGSLNQQGMILDFSDIKQQVKQTIDQHFDHKLLIPVATSNCHIMQQGDTVEIEFQLDSGTWIRHSSPASAVARIETAQINQQSLAAAILHQLTPNLPDNIADFRLRLHNEATSEPCFHYSHGLKQHSGNCQRIAHGHRSRIEVYQDGERNRELEGIWAQLWRDIYIGTTTDLSDEFTQDGEEYFRFAYQADHGNFKLELPKQLCYLVETDSTVENLAQHIADKLKAEHPDSSFQVRVYEGVDKGAIGSS
jgi:6-pyruvoyl-tetrahydropterin synthase